MLDKLLLQCPRQTCCMGQETWRHSPFLRHSGRTDQGKSSIRCSPTKEDFFDRSGRFLLWGQQQERQRGKPSCIMHFQNEGPSCSSQNQQEPRIDHARPEVPRQGFRVHAFALDGPVDRTAGRCFGRRAGCVRPPSRECLDFCFVGSGSSSAESDLRLARIFFQGSLL